MTLYEKALILITNAFIEKRCTPTDGLYEALVKSFMDAGLLGEPLNVEAVQSLLQEWVEAKKRDHFFEHGADGEVVTFTEKDLAEDLCARFVAPGLTEEHIFKVLESRWWLHYQGYEDVMSMSDGVRTELHASAHEIVLAAQEAPHGN